MPQELGLDDLLTIKELISYFGNLHIIDAQLLNKRINILIKSLDLPEKTKCISEPSSSKKKKKKKNKFHTF